MTSAPPWRAHSLRAREASAHHVLAWVYGVVDGVSRRKEIDVAWQAEESAAHAQSREKVGGRTARFEVRSDLLTQRHLRPGA